MNLSAFDASNTRRSGRTAAPARSKAGKLMLFIANSSEALVSSTSIPVTSHVTRSKPRSSSFSFIIPYNKTQACDIYGPICQTGSIAVGLSSGAGTSTTTIPCSSYLDAQSTYLKSFNPLRGQNLAYNWPLEWQTGFGRSPECKSYAGVWQSQGKYTFSGCGTNDAVIQASPGIFLPSQIPPGVIRKHTFQTFQCCGNCSLDIPEVRLYYFPDRTASAHCRARITSKVDANATMAAIDMRTASSLDGLVTVVLSGHTFTSPSVYLELPGTISIKDQCGPFGPSLTNPFVAIPSGQLSTYIPPVELLQSGPDGTIYKDLNGVVGAMFLGTVKSLNVADLACPTFGLGIGTGANGDTYTTIGPPYLPIIVPPPQIKSLDPQWESFCSGFLSWGPIKSFAIFDPPRTLTPVAGLAPDPSPTPAEVPAFTTPTLQSTSVSVSSVVPAQSPTPKSPTPTKALDPTLSALDSLPSIALLDPFNVIDSNPSQPSAEHPNEIPKIPFESQSAAEHHSAIVPINGNIDSTTGRGDKTQETAQALGQLIMGALNHGPLGSSTISSNGKPTTSNNMMTQGEVLTPDYSGVQIAGHTITPGDSAITVLGTSISLDSSVTVYTNGILTTPNDMMIEGDVLTVDHSGVQIAGHTATPGGPAITVSGTSISLDSSGTLYVNGSPRPLPDPSPKSPSSIFAVADQPFTADPTGFSIGGLRVVPGQESVTIAGTPVALHTDGVLVVGTSTIPLQVTPKPAPSVYTVGDETFTANASGFLVAETSILPGGRPAVISGTVVSLDSSGVLVIGSSSVALSPKPTALRDPDSSSIFTHRGLTFTLLSSAVVVDGTTLTLGGPALTINGTTLTLGDPVLTIDGTGVSLGLDGSVAVASQTVVDPTRGGLGTSTAIVPALTGGQRRGSEPRDLGYLVGLLPLFALLGVI